VFIAALILVIWYSACAALSFTGTCTMGSSDSFVAGAIFGIPASMVAVLLLFRSSARPDWRMGFVFLVAALGALVLFLWVPRAFSAGFEGYHLCGPEFDGYLDATGGWERAIPLGHVVVASALFVGGVTKVLRAWRAAQPRVAADRAASGR